MSRLVNTSRLLASFAFILIFIAHLNSAALIITSDFEPEFVATEGTKRFFLCEFDASDLSTLKSLTWTWNEIPLLTYDFQSYQNKFHYDFPIGISINTALSGRERLGLTDLTVRTTGRLRCKLEDVFGKFVEKETFIRVLPNQKRNGRLTGESGEDGLEKEEMTNSQTRTSHAVSLGLIGLVIGLAGRRRV